MAGGACTSSDGHIVTDDGIVEAGTCLATWSSAADNGYESDQHGCPTAACDGYQTPWCCTTMSGGDCQDWCFCQPGYVMTNSNIKTARDAWLADPAAAEATMKTLRRHAGEIVTILDVLIHDPLYRWMVSPKDARHRQRHDDADDGDDASRPGGGAAAPSSRTPCTTTGVVGCATATAAFSIGAQLYQEPGQPSCTRGRSCVRA